MTLWYSTTWCGNFDKGLTLTKEHFSAKKTITSTTLVESTEDRKEHSNAVAFEKGPRVEFHFCYLLVVLKVGEYK